MERRRAVRRTPDRDELLSHVRMRTGQNLAVVDISDWGALVEGPARLLPGTHIEVHVVLPDGRALVRCRIGRSFVHSLDAGSIQYRSALAFEKRIETAEIGYQVPGAFRGVAAKLGTAYPFRPAPAAASEVSPLSHRDLPHRAEAGTAFGASMRPPFSRKLPEAFDVDPR